MSVDLVKKKFDIGEFNKDFEKADAEKELANKIKEDAETAKMSYTVYSKRINEMTLGEILVDWKISFDAIMSDLRNRNLTKSTFTQDNRLFHVGITLLIGILLFYLMYSVLSEPNEGTRIVNEYHIITQTK